MGLDVNNSQAKAGLKPNFFINPIQQNRIGFPRYVSFGQLPDTVELTSELSKYTSQYAIINRIKENPKIREILGQVNVPIKIHMETLYALNRGHLMKTREIAMGIISNLPPELKAQVNMAAIQKAAILHDLGKVLIPKHIINNTNNFNKNELVVMQKHASLGYELLKNTDIDKDTLRLVKYHHQYPDKSGYPTAGNDFDYDINSQIMSLADKYSACREKRTYKKAANPVESIRMIKKVIKGKGYDENVYKALVNYAQQEDILLKAQHTKADLQLQTCK